MDSRIFDGPIAMTDSRFQGVNLQGITEVQFVETPVVGGGLYGTLSGESEVATRVREVVEVDAGHSVQGDQPVELAAIIRAALS